MELERERDKCKLHTVTDQTNNVRQRSGNVTSDALLYNRAFRCEVDNKNNTSSSLHNRSCQFLHLL